jgi:hypothetical protein
MGTLVVGVRLAISTALTLVEHPPNIAPRQDTFLIWQHRQSRRISEPRTVVKLR